MYEDEILRELWKVKEELAKEYAQDPAAYWAELRRLEGEYVSTPRPKIARKRKPSHKPFKNVKGSHHAHD